MAGSLLYVSFSNLPVVVYYSCIVCFYCVIFQEVGLKSHDAHLKGSSMCSRVPSKCVHQGLNVFVLVTLFSWPPLWSSGPEVLGSISGVSRFSEKQRVWNGVHSASWGQPRSYLEEIVAALVKKTETNDREMGCADHATPSVHKSWHYFANKQWSLGRHSLLADQSHGGWPPPPSFI
jgi:hypothetical protein